MDLRSLTTASSKIGCFEVFSYILSFLPYSHAPMTDPKNQIPRDWTPENHAYAVEVLRNRRRTMDVQQYRTDAVVVSRSWKPACADIESKRGLIGGRPSKRSLNNLVFKLNNCDVPMESMFTITMQDQVSRRNSVEFHKRTLAAALQKMRRDGIGQYCWVREFQANRSVHWHVFTDLHVANSGQVNNELSSEWSHWMVDRCRQGWISDDAAKKMVTPSRDGFVGCVRVEQLIGNAGGRYAGKEGSKRFQKIAPKRWKNAGNWWYASRNIACTPVGLKRLSVEALEHAELKINGKTRHIPYRVQFNKGVQPNG